MQYNVAQLLKETTGAVRRYELTENIDALDPDLEILGPLVGKLQLMRTNSGVLATGTFSTAIRANCNRCIEPIAMEVRFELEESFRPSTEVLTGRPLKDREFEGNTDELDDQALVIDSHHVLDLSEVIRQNIWLAMPMFASCNWTGKGECPNFINHRQNLEGVRVIEAGNIKKSMPEQEEIDPEMVEIDPRWAILLKLKEENK